jgi:hypothetical protein
MAFVMVMATLASPCSHLQVIVDGVAMVMASPYYLEVIVDGVCHGDGQSLLSPGGDC